MRVLHIASSLSRSIGGPARSVQGLVAGLQAAGVETYLLVMKPYGDPWVPGIVHYRNAGCKNWFGMQKAVERAIDECRPDIVHIHSIWQWTLHLAVRAARKKNVPYVIAPRGTLEEWSLKQKWFKKKIALLTYQGADLRHAAAFHITAESEGRQLRKLGYGQPLILSPNGVNVPEKGVGKREEGRGKREEGRGKREKGKEGEDWSERRRALAEKKVEERRRALFVSRMHPKKGVLELVEAWARLKQSNNRTIEQWCCELVYTMNSDEERAYEQKVKQRVHELGLDGQFVFTGALDDEKKWEAYARADLFVLPTYSENFGIVVVEALWAGVPVITTKGAPWAELECSESSKFKVQSSKLEERCGWWVENDPGSLAKALCEVFTAPLEEMGRRGRKLVDEKYTWGAVCDKMVLGYEEVLRAKTFTGEDGKRIRRCNG